MLMCLNLSGNTDHIFAVRKVRPMSASPANRSFKMIKQSLR
jgi:hypothetical protein